MFAILGASVGFWCIYALIALIFKHKKSLIITSILGLVAGLGALLARQNYITLVGSVIAIVLIILIKPIQIKKDNK